MAFLFAALRRETDRKLLAAVALLSALSLTLLYTLTPDLAHRQSMWLLTGAIVYSLLRPTVRSLVVQHANLLLFLASAAILFTTLVGHSAGGARSWISVGGYVFQPVEFFKVILVVYWARLLARQGSGGRHAYLLAVVVTLFNVVLLVLQRDLGPVLVLACTGLVWALLLGASRRVVSGVAAGFVGLGVAFIYMFPHLSRRFGAWLSPWNDPYGSGYQTLQARFAMAHGQVTGQGWWGGLTQVPAAATDLPLVALVERLGIIGGLIVLLLLAYIVWRILAAALVEACPLLRQLGLGCGLLLGVEAGIAWAGAVGLLPMVGITLPFVSYGGSSLIAGFTLLALSGDAGVRANALDFLGHRAAFRLTTILALSCVVLACPLGYWTLAQGHKLALHPRYTAQLSAVAAGTRAGIIARDGENLTATSLTGLRVPVLDSLVHTVGYVHPRYGTAGLEHTFDDMLSGRGLASWQSRIAGGAQHTSQVYTTLDLTLQRIVEDALGHRAGAVVVLDPWDGAVLAMASWPRPTVHELDAAVANVQAAPLLNRAVQGLYPAGSAFKPVILAAALESGLVSPQTTWHDVGFTVIDGYRVQNAGGRPLGSITPQMALAHSSNAFFAHLAATLGPAPIRLQAAAFGIGQPHGLEIPYRSGGLGSLSTPVQLAATGIGQGEIQVTPLEMAVVAASVANGGYRVYPYLVTHTEPAHSHVLTSRVQPVRAMSRSTAQVLSEGMRQAVTYGTAAGLVDPSHLAGKTGTAENPHGEPHAWFIGFAPAVQPVVAFAVLVENGGAGARTAGPIARRIAEYVTTGGDLGR